MSFTRQFDDLEHIKKNARQSNNICDYMLNKPGNGVSPSYFDDPFIRLQQWGGNLRTNTINVNSDLKGLTRRINNSDCLEKQQYDKRSVHSNKINYPTQYKHTDQSRATHPVWEYRDLEQVDMTDLTIDNPQNHVFIPFQTDVNSRILEKDNYDNNCKIIK